MPIHLDGPVTAGTVANSVEGVRSSAMPEAAVDAVLDQVAKFADQLVDTYTTEIAAGEIGCERGCESGTLNTDNLEFRERAVANFVYLEHVIPTTRV